MVMSLLAEQMPWLHVDEHVGHGVSVYSQLALGFERPHRKLLPDR